VGSGPVSGLPPLPPGFALDSPQPTPRAPSLPVTPPPLDGDGVNGVVDGDTLDLNSGRHLRIWGVDAPELRQQGLNASGKPVPIGQQSKIALQALVASRLPDLGRAVGQSYGRPVAPLTVQGVDVGHTLARNGNALAVPSYLGADPARRFDYLQAERLARQNGLGIHATRFQPPADFRKAPLPLDQLTPDRTTIPMFWDVPTPFAGMRPEVEKTFVRMINDRSITPEQVAAYAKDNGGFVVDPADVAKSRAHAAKTGLPIAMAYKDAPQVMTDQGDGAFGAAMRGFGNGVLPNWLEETGAVVDSLGATPGRENVWNSNRRIADIWANNAGQNESITAYDRFAHPYAETTGEVAGGLIPFLPALKGENAALNLAKVGGAYGFAAGSGRPGSIPQRLGSGMVGAGEGVVTTVLGGKALEAAAPLAVGAFRKLRGLPPLELPAGGVPTPPEGFRLDPVPMAGEVGPSVSQELRQPDYLFGERPAPLTQPLTEAQMRARSAEIAPGDVLPISSNEVASVGEAAAKDAGRYEAARPVNERTELTRQTVKGWNGGEVPKVGPIDMVGWLRSQGGLADQGGELSHMGMTNAARQGMDFVGQEQRFGPLVNPEGMNLDDAAMRAWEAGYFPDHTERPSVNEFLDVLRDTYEGRNRRFLPQDHAEIDRYHGAQADRYALEQQLQDGPVWNDRSAPAGPDQPFAPPEAYEEWPAGGPDFAGNINLNTLDTPQDIKRALSATEQRVGFDAATRGRVTQAETERLASDLGMTPETLLARRKGQAFNAEEALAARQILAKSGNELVNMAKRFRGIEHPSDVDLAAFREAWLRHAAIQEQVAGATAEAGRALAQFRMAANSRAVKGDVLANLLNGPGGRKRLSDAADALIDAAETSPGKFNVLADKLSKPRWIDKATELRYFMLLSGPQTHAANIISNTLTALGQFPEHAAAAAIGAGRRAVMGREAAADRVYGSEIGSRAFGLLQGVQEGLREFVRTLRTGETSDFAGKMEAPTQPAFDGLAGKVVRAPMRALSAEDEVFKAMARHMELNGLAARQAAQEGLTGNAAAMRIAELTANPSDAMLEKAFDYARYVTFQRPLTGIPQWIARGTQEYPSIKFLVPFVRTPTNLLKFAVERSPAAPLLKEWRADVMAGGARRDLAVAKAMVGSGMGMWMADLASKGLVTGSPPDDDNKNRLLRADGWQPYSFKVGDRYISYNRLDPFSLTISTAADLATKREGMTPKQLDQASGLLVASIMKNMGDKTWLSGLSDFLGMLWDPQRKLGSYAKSQAASLVVPAGVAQVARTIDPTRRETHGVAEEVQSRLPFASEGLFPQRDIWGQPITTERLGPDSLSPITTTTRKNDPVNAEMLRLSATATKFPKQHMVAGKRVDYTPSEYDALQAIAGGKVHADLKALVSSPDWASMSPEAQSKAVAKVIKGDRADARGMPGKQSGAAPPLPPGFSVDGAALGRNVYADLQKAIPGLRFTSGYRDPAYQADMKRRGYHPADNSGHLDGSSFDLLPPAGKSIDWLKQRVRQFDPNARLLNEGDHLHATFPGYFGAPAIGGASKAGLRNPLQGAPALPPGFRLDQ